MAAKRAKTPQIPFDGCSCRMVQHMRWRGGVLFARLTMSADVRALQGLQGGGGGGGGAAGQGERSADGTARVEGGGN